PRVRDPECHLRAGSERHDLIASRVQAERRYAPLRQQIAHVELPTCREQAGRNLGGGRAPAQFVEPRELLRARPGYELCREQLPERRVVPTPTELHEVQDRTVATIAL